MLYHAVSVLGLVCAYLSSSLICFVLSISVNWLVEKADRCSASVKSLAGKVVSRMTRNVSTYEASRFDLNSNRNVQFDLYSTQTQTADTQVAN